MTWLLFVLVMHIDGTSDVLLGEFRTRHECERMRPAIEEQLRQQFIVIDSGCTLYEAT